MTQPLYQQLGGLPRLGPLVDELVDRHAANPALAQRFHGKDLPQLKALSLELFRSGPPLSEWTHLEMTDLAHVGMRFDAQEFASVVDDVIVTLREHGYRPGEVDAVVQLLRRANQGFRAAQMRATRGVEAGATPSGPSDPARRVAAQATDRGPLLVPARAGLAP